MSKKFNALFVLISFTFFSTNLLAQTSSSSPYSRYGVGDLQFGGFTKNLGMGGLAFGYNPPFNINLSNPASNSSIALTTFEIAVNASFTELKNSSIKQNTHNSSLSYFALAFPVIYKKWGAGFGLLPYSNVGYNITDQQTNSAGDLEYHLYEGSGGLNQFFINNGFAPFKNFSVGVTTSYLFGDLNQVRRIYFDPPTTNYLNTRITEATTVGDLYFNFGLQYTFDSLHIAPSDSIKMFDKQLKKVNDSLALSNKLLNELNKVAEKDSQSVASQKGKMLSDIASLTAEMTKIEKQRSTVISRKDKSDWSLTFGLVGTPTSNISGKHTYLAESYRITFEQEYVRDTIENTVDKNGKLSLPLNIGFGFTMKKGNRWLFGADFSLQNWKSYSLFGQSDSLSDSWRAAAGAQFTPNERALKSYFSTIQYRVGGHYSQTYLQLHNTQLSEYGVTLGLGFPVRRAASMLHIAVEAGRRGTISNSLIEENYIKASLGFTLNDRWFVKPKYD